MSAARGDSPPSDAYIAWLAEDTDYDEDDKPLATGRFSGHLEPFGQAKTTTHAAGPDAFVLTNASAEDALSWARDRARRVVVRVFEATGPRDYSAGDEQLVWAEGPLPLWNDSLARPEPTRLPGWEFLDRTEQDAPIAWDVVVSMIQLRTDLPPTFGKAVRETLEQAVPGRAVTVTRDDDPRDDANATPPSGPITTWGGGMLTARLRFEARTLQEAELRARAAVEHAANHARRQLRAVQPDDAWEWDVEAYPSDSPQAAAIRPSE